ncbi:hypothetical protein H257_12729 [Aphanomyces astaci]|uniref:FYVE-type domain-containing protein n=1 Tax=Aphanomyces astaci TaxID=112090 RepID=W4FZ47_APHAT|nr:hypothetical protein H257_12729 [Aphanomyces astaci]ETV72266.1 hypothetical protein H257_12729 [Aphanomyces astaci]|eukprot:XP_009838336.1 hypothetical protein H257_12729 [Aphanomyces astaci]
MATLPPPDEARFKRIAKQATADLVRNALSLPNLKLLSRVQHKATSRHAVIYGGHDSTDPSLPMVGAHTFLRSSLTDLADLFQLNTPAKLDAYGATLGSRITAKQTLFSLTSTEHPAATSSASLAPHCEISWFAYNPPLPGMSKRDYCVLESHTDIEVLDQSNHVRRGWVRCLHSIDDVAWYPPVPNMVRASIARTGLVCIETDTPGLLEVYYVLVPVLTGAAWNVATKRMAKRQVEKILRLEQFLSYQHLDYGRAISASVVSVKNTTKCCARCTKTFHWLRTKRQCHRCLDALCSSCGSNWSVRGKKLFVCHDCFHPSLHDPAYDDSLRGRQMTISITQAKVDGLLEAVATPDVLRDDLDSDSERYTNDTTSGVDWDDEMNLVDDAKLLQLLCNRDALGKLCQQYKLDR